MCTKLILSHTISLVSCFLTFWVLTPLKTFLAAHLTRLSSPTLTSSSTIKLIFLLRSALQGLVQHYSFYILKRSPPPHSLTPLASNQSVLYSPFLHHHWSNYLVLSIISGQYYAYVALCQFAWIPCTVDFNRHLKTKCFFSPLVPHSLQFSWYLCTLFAAVLVFLDSIILKFLLASQNLPLLFWPFLHFCSSIAPTSSTLHFQVTAPHTVCCLVSVSLDSIYH